MSLLRRRWPVLLLLLAPLLPLWRCVLQGQAIGPFAQIRQLAPWNGPKPDGPWDVLQADGVLQFYAWRDLVFDAWGHGQLPLWNPYEFGGTPLLANSQSGGFYPPHILLGLLHVSTGLGMFLLAWTHLAWAGLGTFALVRRLGGTRLGGFTAGALFALSPFMLAWTALPSVVETVAWVPWTLACVIALLCDSDLSLESAAPSQVTSPKFLPRRLNGLLALIGSVGMMILAGHLQFVAYGVLAALVTALVAAVTLRERQAGRSTSARRLLVVCGGFVLGAGLAAPQLLPVLSYSQESHRRAAATGEGYESYVASAPKVTDLVSRLANPFGQGDPTQFVTPEAPFSQFWPAISRPGSNFAESALTIGPFSLALFGLFATKRPNWRAVAPMAVVGIVALLLALGTPLNRLLYFGVPGWSATGSPGRIEVLWVLAACVVGGLALPARAIDPRRAAMGVGLASLLSLATLIPLADVAPAGINPEAWSAIVAATVTNAPRFLLAVGLAGFGVWCAATRRLGGALTLIACLTLQGSVEHLLTIVRTGDPSFLHQRPETMAPGARVAVVNRSWSFVVPPNALYPPNTLSVARVAEIGGYDSLISRDVKATLDRVNGGDSAPPENGNMMFVKPTADFNALAALGVTEVWSREPLPLDGTPQSRGAYLAYPLSGPGRAEGSGGTPITIEDGYDRKTLTLLSDQPAITVRDRLPAGWHPADPSVTIERRDATILRPPADARRIELRYDPPGLRLGVLVGAASVLITLIGIVGVLRLRSPSKNARLAEANPGSRASE